MKYFIGTYSNGYCGCDEEVYIIADSEDQADRFMAEGEINYGYEYAYTTDYEDDEDNAAYWENVTYDLREATQEEIDEVDADCWCDIRNI